jgi:hypothetical protein
MEITNIKPLYRYENADGSISITPNKRNEGDEIHSYSIVADEGYELYYNGENQHTSALYVENTDGWTQEPIEIEPSEAESED